MKCARHPKVDTALRCTRCETPICPDCSIPGAVGMLCRNCASNRDSHVYQMEPHRFILACVTGSLGGIALGLILDALSGAFLYLGCVLGPLFGGLLGNLIWIAAGRKRGLPLEILAGVSVIFGSGCALLITGHWVLLFNPVSLGVYLVVLALTVVAAVGKIRYW